MILHRTIPAKRLLALLASVCMAHPFCTGFLARLAMLIGPDQP